MIDLHAKLYGVYNDDSCEDGNADIIQVTVDAALVDGNVIERFNHNEEDACSHSE